MSDELRTSADATVAAPQYGLGEEILLDYLTGSLDAATALMVAAHLALNPQARAMVNLMTEVGGVMLAETAPAAMDDNALETVLARIDRGDRPGGRADDAAVITDEAGEIALLPDVVQQRMRAHGGKWSFAAPGVKRMDLGFERAPGDGPAIPAEVKLYRLEPGYGVPTHTHKGQEITLVLTGAFVDEKGRYGPGDVSVATPDLTHRPVTEKGGVCYALVIMDAPLQLTGALGLVQRALGQAD